MQRLWTGQVAFDPRDDWLIELANELHARNERLQAEIECYEAVMTKLAPIIRNVSVTIDEICWLQESRVQ